MNQLSGIVVDDTKAELTGDWREGSGLKNYIEDGYHYIGANSGGIARFNFTVPADGDYEVRVSHQPHPNRSSKTKVTVVTADGEKTTTVNQQIAPTARQRILRPRCPQVLR
jgi:hypothetical protein